MALPDEERIARVSEITEATQMFIKACDPNHPAVNKDEEAAEEAAEEAEYEVSEDDEERVTTGRKLKTAALDLKSPGAMSSIPPQFDWMQSSRMHPSFRDIKYTSLTTIVLSGCKLWVLNGCTLAVLNL